MKNWHVLAVALGISATLVLIVNRLNQQGPKGGATKPTASTPVNTSPTVLVIRPKSPSNNSDPPALTLREPAKLDSAGAWAMANKPTFVVHCTVGLATIPPKFVSVEGGIDINTDGCEAECLLTACYLGESLTYPPKNVLPLTEGQKTSLQKSRSYWAVNPANVSGR